METTKRVYGPAVLMTDWQQKREAHPKDFDAYCPVGGSVHRSTYNRLGQYNPPTFPISATRYMQEQIGGKSEPQYKKTPFISFTSFPCIDTPERQKDQEKSGLAQYPKNYGYMDYKTTMQISYQKPFKNMPAKPLLMADPPYLLNQRMRSLLGDPGYGFVPPKYGIRTFEDEDMFDPDTARDRQAELKRYRSRSFNPGTGKYTDQPVPIVDPCTLA